MTARYSAAQIAQVCHEAIRALQAVQGVPVPLPPWGAAPLRQTAHAAEVVDQIQAGASMEQLHEEWCEEKRADGWTLGLPDPQAKTHPRLAPYDELPADLRDEDDLLAAVVWALNEDRPLEFDTDGRDPETVALTGHFAYAHLPDDLAVISRTVAATAALMFNNLPDDPELKAGLRSLLQAKDAFVRTAVVARGQR